MKDYKTFVGIDISKGKLDAWVLRPSSPLASPHTVVENSQKGLKQLASVLKKAKVNQIETLYCFEDTGVYGMPLCFYLESLGADYWMVSALDMKRSMGITRGKNDKVDSGRIALFAQSNLHKLKLCSTPAEDIMKLKLLISERGKLVKAIKLFENTLESDGFLPPIVTREVFKANRKTVAALKKSLKEIEAQMLAVQKANETIDTQSKLIQSLPGVGPQTAIYLIATSRCFQSFGKWRQMACYAGIAPFEYTSGTSIRGRTKVSHLADKKMKTLLNMCALNAKRLDPELKLYYERKCGEGKNPMLVMNNLRCKILSRIFAIVQRGTPYVNTQKFAA